MKISSYYALLVGINEYEDNKEFPDLRWAENDCDELVEVLTGEIGCFSEANVIKLLGPEATTSNIQKKLYNHIVKDRTFEDTVLVYFSGHAFHIPFQDKVFLAATDTVKGNVLENPFQGISLPMLYEEIFRKTKAHIVIFILDTCYSGAIIPTGVRSDQKKSFPFDESYTREQGRVAIVSSPPNILSREDDHLQHGVFTYWLIKGLKGESYEVVNDSGEITLDRVMDYIKMHAPQEQPFGRFGYEFGQIVLTRPGLPKETSVFNKVFQIPDTIELKESSFTHKGFSNTLSPYEDIINQLINNIKLLGDSKLESQSLVLEAIRKTTEADIVLMLINKGAEWSIKSTSEFNKDIKSISEYIETAITTALKGVIQSQVIGPELTGIYQEDMGLGDRSILTIPIKDTYPVEILLICGSDSSLFKSDIFSEILNGIYQASHGFLTPYMHDVELLEGLTMDWVKTIHKFVPQKFYYRRHELFMKRLEAMTVLFQPIIYLSPTNPYVCGFEALAYDEQTNASPQDLFSTAELWGPKFTLDLDLFFLETSLNNYKELLQNTTGMRRPQDVLDISINVYPGSLLRTTYFRKFEEMTSAEKIPNERIYLEISEKQHFPEVHNEGIAKGTDITDFRGILEKYVSTFGIGFGIDDFGVGFSSIERLASLHPSFMKVDRALLLLDTSQITINFVISFMNTLTSHRFLKRSKIVLEGFDFQASQNISLRDLYTGGVRYIQGYIIGKPRIGELYRLSVENKNFLISELKRNVNNGNP